jgi:hypothetical protein
MSLLQGHVIQNDTEKLHMTNRQNFINTCKQKESI